eukprot:CAMPEP_0178421258 /NCGR_PEP_ID=MMETSP0689_2-20121128/26555_1 /TAXON_ID=160604 /ORGANISM="Amphidinium massartii, Strain CS-259" /LENGTH=221 /DNA_ID=CAMNT_0020042765 /DNA_START=72 /DNA_END=738 /DNA_ORIENTATION=+
MGLVFGTNPAPEEPELLARSGPGKERVVIAVSGKRAAGKDYISSLILAEVARNIPGARVTRLAFADRCKKEFAEKEGLNLEQLHKDRSYKELHRAKMTEYYLQTVAADPTHFIDGVVREARQFLEEGEGPALDLDLRHLTEVKSLRTPGSLTADEILLVRVNADDSIRQARGWVPDPEKDLSSTECDLDTLQSFGWVLQNHDSEAVKEEVRSRVLPMFQRP